MTKKQINPELFLVSEAKQSMPRRAGPWIAALRSQ
jgi:hypothetical protein